MAPLSLAASAGASLLLAACGATLDTESVDAFNACVEAMRMDAEPYPYVGDAGDQSFVNDGLTWEISGSGTTADGEDIDYVCRARLDASGLYDVFVRYP